jgi:hypothetical protein
MDERLINVLCLVVDQAEIKYEVASATPASGFKRKKEKKGINKVQ